MPDVAWISVVGGNLTTELADRYANWGNHRLYADISFIVTPFRGGLNMLRLIVMQARDTCEADKRLRPAGELQYQGKSWICAP